MSTGEQLWFTVGIAGFIILLEGAISFLGLSLFKKANQNIVKFVGGIIIYVFALIMLLNVV